MSCFSPRNGEAILKQQEYTVRIIEKGFSPRNGEAILKGKIRTLRYFI